MAQPTFFMLQRSGVSQSGGAGRLVNVTKAIKTKSSLSKDTLRYELLYGIVVNAITNCSNFLQKSKAISESANFSNKFRVFRKVRIIKKHKKRYKRHLKMFFKADYVRRQKIVNSTTKLRATVSSTIRKRKKTFPMHPPKYKLVLNGLISNSQKSVIPKPKPSSYGFYFNRFLSDKRPYALSFRKQLFFRFRTAIVRPSFDKPNRIRVELWSSGPELITKVKLRLFRKRSKKYGRFVRN